MLLSLVKSYIAVITRPGKASFDAAKSQANWMNTIVGVVIWGLVAGLFAVVSGPGVLSITMPIRDLIVFFIFSAMVFVVAKVMGGTGDFKGNYFMLSLFVVPIGIIEAVLGIFPAVGGIVVWVVLRLYSFFLLYHGLQSAHNLAANKSLIVTVISMFAGVLSWLFAVNFLWIALIVLSG